MTRWSEQRRVSCLFWSFAVLFLVVLAVMALWPWE